jgi:hypothetical protein
VGHKVIERGFLRRDRYRPGPWEWKESERVTNGSRQSENHGVHENEKRGPYDRIPENADVH